MSEFVQSEVRAILSATSCKLSDSYYKIQSLKKKSIRGISENVFPTTNFSKNSENFSKISENFSKISENFSKISENCSKITENFSKITENFSKLFENFSKLFENFSKIVSIRRQALYKINTDLSLGDSEHRLGQNCDVPSYSYNK